MSSFVQCCKYFDGHTHAHICTSPIIHTLYLKDVSKAYLRSDRESVLDLRVVDNDNIGLLKSNTVLSSRIVREHDGDLDTDDTLLEVDVTLGLVNVVDGGGTGRNHISLLELHGLSTRTTELTSDHDLTTLSTILHDVTEDTVTSTTNWETSIKLVTERLTLGDSAQSTVLDTLMIK